MVENMVGNIPMVGTDRSIEQDAPPIDRGAERAPLYLGRGLPERMSEAELSLQALGR